MTTNIVLLAHDRLRLTEQALESLYAHTDRAQFNLTLVDDASSDFRVQRLLKKFGEKSNATLLRIETSAHVLARAKNIGVAWSEQTFGRGDWLYISDSDVYFAKGWLEKLTACFVRTESLGMQLIGGQVHPYHQPLSTWGEDLISGSPPLLTEHCVLDGPSWLMRWETWEDMGDMDSGCAPGVCQGEDGGWCDRLREKGGRIGAIHPHVVSHTGLTNSAGQDAPGRKEREAMRWPGVLYE